MNTEWTSQRREQFLSIDESDFNEVEPGLRASRPVLRVTPADKRCTHAYYTSSPLSADGRLLTWLEYHDTRIDRRVKLPITGRIIVAASDGSGQKVLQDNVHGTVNSGAMQQWLGETHRVGWIDRRDCWWVADCETGETWQGSGLGREFSPEGDELFIQTGEDVHLKAETEGRSLTPEDVAARIIRWNTGEETARISVADVLAIHPDAAKVRRQHMCFKQTLFSPDGQRIAVNFSNAWYTRHRKDEEFRHEKLIARPDGSELRHLGAGASHPGWHPTGQFYFAIAPDEQGVNRFTLYPVDGSAPFRAGGDWLGGGHPSFQPGDGRYLAVDYFRAGKGHVFLRLYDLENESYEDILVAEYTDYSNDSGIHFHPAWSPDGRSLFIASEHTGIAGLYRIDPF